MSVSKHKDRQRDLVTTDLRLSCIEGNGLCGDPRPEQSEGLHVASPLCNLSNSNVGVWAKNLIVKRLEIPCSQNKTDDQLIHCTKTTNIIRCRWIKCSNHTFQSNFSLTSSSSSVSSYLCQNWMWLWSEFLGYRPAWWPGLCQVWWTKGCSRLLPPQLLMHSLEPVLNKKKAKLMNEHTCCCVR